MVSRGAACRRSRGWRSLARTSSIVPWMSTDFGSKRGLKFDPKFTLSSRVAFHSSDFIEPALVAATERVRDLQVEVKPPCVPASSLQTRHSDGSNGYTDIGITADMPSPGLCRIWQDGSSVLCVWRYFPHFSD